MGAGQFRRNVGGKQDVEWHAFSKTLALDSLRLSGNIPEPSFCDFVTADAGISRSIIDDDIPDLELLNRRQNPGRIITIAAITEGVIVGPIRGFFYEQLHACK